MFDLDGKGGGGVSSLISVVIFVLKIGAFVTFLYEVVNYHN